MKKNKGISSLISIFIVLALSLGAYFLIQQYTEIGNMSGPEISYPPKENENREDLEEDLKEDKEKQKPKVAIIIDDCGNNFETDKQISEINNNLTLAILPGREDSIVTANYFNNFDRFQLMLHLPLEPIDPKDEEKNMIMTNMDEKEIKEELNSYLQELGEYIVGINNHKGSEFTSNREKMKILLEEAKKNNLFFIDSFTYKDSVAYQIAREINLKTAKRDIFLDNADNKEKIRNKLNEALELAKAKGKVVVIGHSKPNTIAVLREEMVANNQIEFVKASEIIE